MFNLKWQQLIFTCGWKNNKVAWMSQAYWLGGKLLISSTNQISSQPMVPLDNSPTIHTGSFLLLSQPNYPSILKFNQSRFLVKAKLSHQSTSAASLDCSMEEQCLRGNPWRDWESMQTPHRERSRPSNPSIHPSIRYHCLCCTQGQGGDQSQLSLVKGRLHLGQFASLSHRWHQETNKHPHSFTHSHL